MKDGIVVLITASGKDEAKRISDKLLTMKKAACVNIIDRVSSHFLWRGRKDSAKESLLIVKSRSCHLDDIIKIVKKIHSYKVPEIIAIPIKGGNRDYLEWIEDETS
jgi:periplasmic divalent cation tolerance protein